jgi:nucleoside-diphosphate-sugar epimerase
VNAPSELHVVFGSGPVGLAVVDALMARDKRIRVVLRSGARRSLPTSTEVVHGDATDSEDTRRICAGASHVYNCTNARDYHRWPEQFPPLQRGILAGATAAGAKLIVMENLYMYGPHGGIPITEAMPLRGHGSRSTTRRLMTEELFAAHQAGDVRAVSVRASDLFGPYVTESLAGQRFFEPLLHGKKVQLFADPDVPHSVSFVGDVGRAMVRVGEHDEALGRAWHAPNAPAVTLRALAELVGEETGLVPRLCPGQWLGY